MIILGRGTCIKEMMFCYQIDGPIMGWVHDQYIHLIRCFGRYYALRSFNIFSKPCRGEQKCKH